MSKNKSKPKSEEDHSAQSVETGQRHSAPVIIPKPVFRALRGYAFDPSLSIQLDTAVVNETLYTVDWEDAATETDEGLTKGPVGEYIEVIDYDPASGCFYAPIDLNDPYILAQDGLAPSEGNPQFHQQMVYAVIMTTIKNFERALGRPALWSPYNNKETGEYEYVRRLRVYPHALREANAYYSPAKKSLLFGYFPALSDRPGRFLPGGLVFTCLSHDIVAHETTHALLDGMHGRFIEPSHPDSLAFHEAFADIVALFQHFSFPDVLRHQIGRTRGDLSSQNLLGELAQQFGEAIGNYGALRSAIGKPDPDNNKWQPADPNPDDYETETEPHRRGAILVAAVFDAFLAIYRRRVSDLLRIASSGTGILPEGELHPDLVNRLTAEAARAAQHILNACIRALDYCPPVDITFGDYLRALITADMDLVPSDPIGYRIAIIDAFRKRGIYPQNIRTLSPESLCWSGINTSQGFFEPMAEQLRRFSNELTYFKDREDIYVQTEKISASLNLWIKRGGHMQLRDFSSDAGITFEFNLDGLRGKKGESGAIPSFQVHSLRCARRVGPDGNTLNQLIVSIIQTRDVPLNIDENGAAIENGEEFKFRGGSTLILDLDTMKLRYAIRKNIGDNNRLSRHRRFLQELMMEGSLQATYFKEIKDSSEPFAFLHLAQNDGRP